MTKQFYFSKITLRREAPFAKVLHFLRDADSAAYDFHKALWELLPESQAKRNQQKAQKRDDEIENLFLYRHFSDSDGVPFFYLLSQEKPSEKHEIWDCGTPKDYAPVIELGDTFRFSLRVNPTKTVDTTALREYKEQNGKPRNESKTHDRKTRRVDVIWDTRCKARERDPRPPDERSWTNDGVILEAATTWLSERAARPNHELGFELVPDTLLVERYERALHPKHQCQSVRSREDFSNAKKLSTLDLAGLLKVTDVEKFQTTLTSGIGHGKAFGCGLLLIRRV